ncbi:hypothetical protein DL95DRAFT_471357 [Leptodontidium sp. 2 PMI_412]|nr:hypothetical protein DL95DRAFT_471357 [Leptodontidium sp. 2 PMI_412]
MGKYKGTGQLRLTGDKVILIKEATEEGSKKPSEKKEARNPFVTYEQLWGYATRFDVTLRIIRFIAACAAGVALPLMTPYSSSRDPSTLESHHS